MLYSMPADSFTLINDDKDKIYLVKIKNFLEIKLDRESDRYKSYIDKENTRIRKSILQSYDNFLNDKYQSRKVIPPNLDISALQNLMFLKGLIINAVNKIMIEGKK